MGLISWHGRLQHTSVKPLSIDFNYSLDVTFAISFNPLSTSHTAPSPSNPISAQHDEIYSRKVYSLRSLPCWSFRKFVGNRVKLKDVTRDFFTFSSASSLTLQYPLAHFSAARYQIIRMIKVKVNKALNKRFLRNQTPFEWVFRGGRVGISCTRTVTEGEIIK